MIAALVRALLLAAGAAALLALLTARRQAARRGVGLPDVLPELPALLRAEVGGLVEDLRAAARDGGRAAAERRRELHGDLADARLGGG